MQRKSGKRNYYVIELNPYLIISLCVGLLVTVLTTIESSWRRDQKGIMIKSKHQTTPAPEAASKNRVGLQFQEHHWGEKYQIEAQVHMAGFKCLLKKTFPQGK